MMFWDCENKKVTLNTLYSVFSNFKFSQIQYTRFYIYFIFIVPCIVIFYGITNRCDNVQ